MRFGSFRELVSRHRFTFAIAAIIGVAVAMTGVSLSLYVSSGTSRLDLSRPGYEAVRKDVKVTPEETFPTDGPVDRKALDEFSRLLQKSRNNLNALGDFEDTSLDDATLRLQAESAN